ncbi:MAG: N-acetylmuramoyl-L-alanine amidase [Muribaculaceae bacterium]|nr:N-acetylmuramoyl-L-alanine amidase [Muribaculaceae bacterium]
MLLQKLYAAVVIATALVACAAVRAYGEETAHKADFTVVLDAGHGGHDKGCQGRSQMEKEITLDVAKRVGKLLKNSLSDSIDIVYTRKDDTFIPLDRRAAVANEAGADLFVSIHVNSIDKRTRGREKVHGASVYTVGLHKSDANLAVAMRENAVIELEEDYSVTYQGFDPNSDESYIIFELEQNSNMDHSLALATGIQERLVSKAGRADKGVRQAGFLVLWATTMPSVLVELDFICNPAAERFLASSEGRDRCAGAIADAVAEYRNTRHARNTRHEP